MKEKTKTNPYATVRGGKIDAPRGQKNEPRVTRTTGSDLRIKRK